MMINIAVFVLMGVMVTFGGASRMDVFNPTIARLAAIPLLIGAIYRLWLGGMMSSLRYPLGVLAAIVLLLIFQLIPLPPAIWGQLPGHGFLLGDYGIVGIPLPWLPLSLTPDATINAAFSLMPPTAVFLVAAQCDLKQRRVLMIAVVLFALANVVLGSLQIAGGPESPLRFYKISNQMEAIGVFANRDHLASLLVVSLLIVVWWMSDTRTGSNLPPIPTIAIGMSIVFVLMVGMAFTRSRSAVVLGFVSIMGSFALAVANRSAKSGRSSRVETSLRKRIPWKFVIISLAAIAITATTAIALGGTLERLKGMDFQERWALTPLLWRVGCHFFPFGSGLGSFDPVYRIFEPRSLIDYAYLNHAHDDYMEIWITAGVGGTLLLLAGAGWIAWRTVVFWAPKLSASKNTMASAQGRTGALILLIFMLHSVGDYPLRTSTLACVFALGCALLVSPREISSRQ